MLMKKAFLFLLVFVALVACNKAAVPGASGPKDAGKVLANINGMPITEGDLKREIGYLQPEAREMFAEEGGLKAVLEEVIKKDMLYQEAKKLGLQDSQDIKDRLEEYKKRATIELLLEKNIMDTVKVDDKEVRDFYDKNIDSFVMQSPDGKGKPRTIEFDKVKGLIKERLTQDKQKEAFDKYMDSLKSKYKVEVNQAALDQLPPIKGGGAVTNAPSGMNEPAMPAGK